MSYLSGSQKGGKWRFEMKAHIGLDSRSKRVHSAARTAANVHDSQALLGSFFALFHTDRGYARIP